MEPKSETTATPFPTDLFPTLGARSIEALTALAQVNQAVIGQLIELGSTATREAFRACTDLQTASLDAARSVPAPALPSRDSLDQLRQDPFAWYRKALSRAADDAQQAARFVEESTQIVTRGTERFRATAERAGTDIRAAVTLYADRMKALYASN